MGFQQGLSGLNAAAKNLDVIGNNVANANTAGFKGSQAQFADVYASAQGGSTGSAVGIGVKVATIAQQFGQGNITSTGNPLDIAISGQGFFEMNNNGAISYTRNGQFQMDANGFIVNSQGHKLSGYPVNPLTGLISTGSAGPLQLPTAAIPPLPTTTSKAGVNLDSRSTVPTTAVFNPTDPTSYNSSTAMTVYDSLGNTHVATMYFVKTAAANTWAVHLTVDNLAPNGAAPTSANTLESTMTFSSTGLLASTVPATVPLGTVTVTGGITYTNGSTTPQPMTIDFAASTQFGAPFGVNQLTQNGYTSGQLNGFSTSSDGTIVGRYTNGQSQPLGQVLLVNFANAQGLQPLGNNEWSSTSTSGQPLVGVPGTSSLGILQSGATEDSNVDLTAELVNMITAQRVYQANAQTIKTQDQVMQTITNLR
ncbi:MAG TPA: flagellar hook protein FlgE [Gallionellaceae bacterium]|nr:flagellar hook protein FlgE [Gallionellaceae bacterium]